MEDLKEKILTEIEHWRIKNCLEWNDSLIDNLQDFQSKEIINYMNSTGKELLWDLKLNDKGFPEILIWEV